MFTNEDSSSSCYFSEDTSGTIWGNFTIDSSSEVASKFSSSWVSSEPSITASDLLPVLSMTEEIN